MIDQKAVEAGLARSPSGHRSGQQLLGPPQRSSQSVPEVSQTCCLSADLEMLQHFVFGLIVAERAAAAASV